MTTSLEKTLLIYILKNREYIQEVESHYFKNNELRKIFSTIKSYVEERSSAPIPKPKQIFEMVNLKYEDNPLDIKLFKIIFKEDLINYDEENFLKPSLEKFITKNRIADGGDKIIDKVRELEDINDSLKIEEIAGIIREIAIQSTNTEIYNNGDLGSDFDDEEAHIQDHSILRVPSGWGSVDLMLGGGFDRESLCILMGATNSGKSLWLQNITTNIANLGYNVVYFTLEMSEKKVLKRIGSMRLRIPINQYDKFSMDPRYIKQKIDDLMGTMQTRKNTTVDSLFKRDIGKINVKNFATGNATIAHLDNYLDKLQKVRNFTPDVIIIDYLTLLAPQKGLGVEGNLYMKGKHLAEGVRALGKKYNSSIISAMQVSKDAWNASDITLDKIPESKAIAETADTFFAIIRTEEMKRDNEYKLKLLKQRDGDFSRSLAGFSLNPNFLSIENDQIIL